MGLSVRNTMTLVPVGGLGNRIGAIGSALCFCQEKHRNLEIIWFKDQGLNCDFDKLFFIDPKIKNVTIRNAKAFDFILRDNPRKRNLWIPRLFEKHLYNKCIYADLVMQNEQPAYDEQFDSSPRIYMVSCGVYWKCPNMYQWIRLCNTVEEKVKQVTDSFPANTIGIHIRRTDNAASIKYSPTRLFVEVINKEIENDNNVKFYVASDSIKEKEYLISLYGDRIITSMEETARNTEEGIINAFVEMNILSRTNKLYGGYSSYAQISAALSDVNFTQLDLMDKL